MSESKGLIQALIERGVEIPCPEAVVIRDVDPARFEPGVTIHPGCTIEGSQSLFGAGTSLGRAGGGWFSDVRTGRRVELHGGSFEDCVFLDDVTLRGAAEVRGGTLLEEQSGGAHAVGLKMSIFMPRVLAGSLVNFCDALVSGGTSRRDHSEIGSSLALYNYSPWGEKYASLFGDVPRGVFLRSPRIFVGGQTQIVSPIKVGFGALIPAGAAVRRSVDGGRVVGGPTHSIDAPFDSVAMGGLMPKFELAAEYVGNLHALDIWYSSVRLEVAQDDFEVALYEAAREQIQAGIMERLQRLDATVDKIPASRERHLESMADTSDAEAIALHQRRIQDHDRVLELWPEWRERLEEPSIDPVGADTLLAIADQLRARMQGGWLEAIASLADPVVESGATALESIVRACLAPDSQA